MTHRTLANTISLLIGGALGAGAFYAYYQFLSKPRPFSEGVQVALMDWAVDLGAGLSVAIIFFFVVWGHFQQDGQEKQETPVAPTKSE